MIIEITITAVVTALVTHFAPKAWFYYRVIRNRPSPLGYVVAVDQATKIITVKVKPAVCKRESITGSVAVANYGIQGIDDELALQTMDDELTAYHSEIWGDEPRVRKKSV